MESTTYKRSHYGLYIRPFIHSVHSAREGEAPLPPHPSLGKGGMGGGRRGRRKPLYNCLIIRYQEYLFYYETVNKMAGNFSQKNRDVQALVTAGLSRK